MAITTDREPSRSEPKAYDYAVRRIEGWAIERRQQERQYAAFREDLVRIRITSNDDGATAAVFHGNRQMTRRERILAEHREQLEIERRRELKKAGLAVRRGTGVLVYCKHCGRLVRAVDERRKCERCKNDPDLITARGTETRTYIPRPEAQPTISPLSAAARRIDAMIDELPSRERDVLERRFLHKQSDPAGAEDLRMSVAVFAGLAHGAIAKIALVLAHDAREPV